MSCKFLVLPLTLICSLVFFSQFVFATAVQLGSLTGSNVTYLTPVSIIATSANINDADVNYTLWRNTTLVASHLGSTTPTLTDLTVLGAGWYSYTYNASLGANYTANSTGLTLGINVSKATPVVTLGTIANVTYPNLITIYCTSSDNAATGCKLYRNTTTTVPQDVTGASNNTAIKLGSAWWNYTANVSSSANWTVNSNISYVFITQATPTVTIGAVANVTYPTNITAYCTSTDDDNSAACKLYRNTTTTVPQDVTGASNNTPITLGAGWWNYIANSSSQNYTLVSNTSNVFITAGTMNITLILNGTAANRSYTYPAATNATGNMSVIFAESAYNMTLLRDDVSKATTTSGTSVSENILFGAGTYNYTLLWSSANYTVSNISTNRFAIVNPANFTIDLFLNGTAANKFYPNTSFANFSTVTNITTNTTPITLHLDTNISGISAWVNITNTSTVMQNTTLWNSSADKSYNITAYITPNTNYTSNSSTWYFKQDVTKPIYANQTNVNGSVVFAAGNQAHEFDISVFDSFAGEQTALLEFNMLSQSNITNYTATNTTGTSSGDVFTYTFNGLPAGNYQYKWYVIDTVGNTNTTSLSTYTVSAGSDNGGNTGGSETETTTTTTHAPSGGAPPSTTPPSNTTVAQETEVLHKVIAGEPSSVNISNSDDLKVQEISIVLNRNVSNVQLSVVDVPSPSANIVISTTSGSVYKYLQISKTNVQDSDISNATITFKVEKSWLNSNSIDKSTVTLNRLVNASWTKLPTSETSEDSSFVYYTALSPGFSTFAITGSKSVQTTTTTSSPPQATTTTTQTTPAPTTSQPDYTLVYVLALVVIILVGFFLYRSQKHKKQ